MESNVQGGGNEHGPKNNAWPAYQLYEHAVLHTRMTAPSLSTFPIRPRGTTNHHDKGAQVYQFIYGSTPWPIKLFNIVAPLNRQTGFRLTVGREHTARNTPLVSPALRLTVSASLFAACRSFNSPFAADHRLKDGNNKRSQSQHCCFVGLQLALCFALLD